MRRACRTVALALALTAVAGHAQTPPPPADGKATASFEEQFRAAQALAFAGRRAEAIAAYTALLRRAPRNADVLLGRGRVYAWEKRWAEAEADLRAATARSPRYADAWSALGDMYLWSDRPEQAADAYGRWVQLRPDDGAARLARGRAFRAAGDPKAARSDFETAARLGADREAVNEALRSMRPRVENPEADVPEGYDWSLQLGSAYTEFSPERAEWAEHTVSVRRHFGSWSLAAEWLGADRFEQTDAAWALDAYVDAWPRAYANLRLQQGPDGRLYPENSWRAELFQGVGSGWELSAGLDQLNFRSNTVDIYSAGVGKYVGAWYLRWKQLFTHSGTSDGTSAQVLGRWYYAGNGDDYLELRAGSGRSTQDLAGTPGVTAPRDSSSAGLAVVRYPHPNWGFKLSASYGDDQDSFVARAVGATLYLRW